MSIPYGFSESKTELEEIFCKLYLLLGVFYSYRQLCVIRSLGGRKNVHVTKGSKHEMFELQRFES